jgi:hypothetical protein
MSWGTVPNTVLKLSDDLPVRLILEIAIKPQSRQVFRIRNRIGSGFNRPFGSRLGISTGIRIQETTNDSQKKLRNLMF